MMVHKNKNFGKEEEKEVKVSYNVWAGNLFNNNIRRNRKR